MSRVTATVLFTDLVGATELRGQLGEGAAEERRRRHDRLLAEAVERPDGRLVKGLDGIMATCSGAADAVATAVAIEEAVDRLNPSGKQPVALSVRVGLSAGDVTFEGDDVHGTPVMASAESGQILAGGVVAILAGVSDDQLTDDRGRLELKPLHKPAATWETAGSRPHQPCRCPSCSPTSGGSSWAGTPRSNGCSSYERKRRWNGVWPCWPAAASRTSGSLTSRSSRRSVTSSINAPPNHLCERTGRHGAKHALGQLPESSAARLEKPNLYACLAHARLGVAEPVGATLADTAVAVESSNEGGETPI